ncbi:N-acetyltransferase [Desulfatiferula olefinivorans]
MIRKATIKDIKAIHALLSDYGERGVLLSRPLSQLYDHVRDFFVFEIPETGGVGGCGALQFCWEDLAEIRSLAVRKEFQGRNIGRYLVESVIAEARAYGIKQLFTLTYRPDFFKKFQFSVIDRAELPLKIWSDCISCVKFPDCDETAMMLSLDPHS